MPRKRAKRRDSNNQDREDRKLACFFDSNSILLIKFLRANQLCALDQSSGRSQFPNAEQYQCEILRELSPSE